MPLLDIFYQRPGSDTPKRDRALETIPREAPMCADGYPCYGDCRRRDQFWGIGIILCALIVCAILGMAGVL